jgi:hypothetical protein
LAVPTRPGAFHFGNISQPSAQKGDTSFFEAFLLMKILDFKISTSTGWQISAENP